MYLKSYKELIVWQKSILLVREVFVLTNKFPRSELYGISSQMRRAAVSIPSNIAEGYGRKSQKEYTQACSVSYGSGLALETQLIIAKELLLAENNAFTNCESILEEVLKMLKRMRVRLQEDRP